MPNYDYTVSSFTLPNGAMVEIKDEVARNAQQSGMHYIGLSTDENLVDGYTTAAIAMSGKVDPVTAVTGDIVTKGNKEFLFDGASWHEMGDLSSLGSLASKDSASATYTPAGIASGADVTLTTTTKYVASSVTGGASVVPGSPSSFSASVNNEVLEFSWTPGTPTVVTMPSFISQAIATDVGAVTQPIFTGTSATITVT